jgi:hypothetical protein
MRKYTVRQVADLCLSRLQKCLNIRQARVRELVNSTAVKCHGDIVTMWQSSCLKKKKYFPVCKIIFVWVSIFKIKKFKNFLIIKPTRCTNFSNVFWNETLHVSDSSSVHHQELFTVHSAMVYVIQVCRQLESCMTYTIAECTVNNSWWWTEELSETSRVSFPK